MAIQPANHSPLGATLERQSPNARATASERHAQVPEFKRLWAASTADPPVAERPAVVTPKAAQIPTSSPVLEHAQPAAVDAPLPLAERSMNAVKQAMMNAGIPLDGVSFSYREELVWYPGGNWVNHMLTASTSDGRSIDFSANLAERSPHVTAAEIDSFLLKA